MIAWLLDWLIDWLRLSAVWYGVGYDIQSLNMAVCLEILIFLGNLCLTKLFFFYSSQKPHSNHVFPRFNHSSIVTYVINNRWHHILSRWSNLVDCSTTSKCSNDEKSILGFSSSLKLIFPSTFYNYWHIKKLFSSKKLN